MALVALAVVGTMAPAASARDGKKGDHKEARKEAKEAHKEAKEDLKDAKKDLKEAEKDAAKDGVPGPGGAAVKEARTKLVEARRRLKETREERRRTERTALQAKWGKELLAKPAVRAELRLHAQRMAKLRQMKNVADDADKKNLEERVDKLIEREKARHAARMDALKAKNGEDSK